MNNALNGCAETHRRTVLIVDDTPEDRHVYRRYLMKDEEWRYHTLEAGTGAEALALSRETRPDCILLDYRLPDLTGLEVLAAMAQDCVETACPVVVLTAEEDVAVAVAALKSGAQDYLNKNTLTAVDLSHAINNAIERVAMRRENERQRRAMAEQNRRLEEMLATQKVLDENLRDIWEQMTGIIESAMDAIITVDDQGRVVIFNASAERMFGCSAAEAAGQPIRRFIPGRTGEAPEAHFCNLIGGQKNTRSRGPLDAISGVRANGEEFPIEASHSQVDAGGKRLSTIILRDITERKQAEAALRESERRFRGAVESFPHAFILYDGQRRYQYINDWAAQFSRLDRSVIIGKRDEEIWPPSITDHYLPALDRAIKTKKTLYFELSPRPQFDNRTMIVTYVPICDDRGEVSQVLTIAYDITERKRVEQERDLLLQREQQARRLAEEANRAKDEFLAIVTHELRSPLNAMLGYARIQCAKRRIDAEDAKRAFETIRRNGERQRVLIDDLLDTARIITGKLRIEVGPVDLAIVINEAIEAVRPSADLKLIKLSSKLNLRAGRVTGDAERLQQVIWNLLTNAVKFTPEGGRVEVALECSGPRVTITVSDTGKGITPEFLPRIFDRFTQQDTSHSRRYSGLGLGLSLVKQLVEMHGGEIRATSAGEGRGATFTVDLPTQMTVEKSEPVVDRRQGVTRELRPTVTAPLHPLSSPLSDVGVLLVDDEEDARTLVTKVLKDSGANVVAVSSALEAFAMITEPPSPDWPDVLICDIGMPEEDGYSLMRRIRDWEQGRDLQLPSVALTSYNRTEDRVNAIGAGYKMHIAKPVEPEEMVAVIKSLASRGKSPDGQWRKAHSD